jgi:hypothetical protein
MAWDDVQTLNDCITPAEWNNMVTYIKAISTSGCSNTSEVTHTMYRDCTNETGQEFKFSFDGDDSIIEGDDTSGQNLILKATTADTYPYIKLEGAAGLIIDVANDDEIQFLEAGNQFFKFDHAADDSIIYGGDASTEDLHIIANTVDGYPKIVMQGNLNLELHVANEEEIILYEGGVQYFLFDRSGIISELYGGSSTGNELKIFANTADSYPYILLDGDSNITLYSTADISFYEQAEEFFRFKLNGTISEIWGSDDTGDDLYIYSNQADSCPIIQLFGNSGISNKIKAGSIFDISTCSGEPLFEVVTTSPMHINHHCLEAYEFRLENRTSDPSAPTCVGRIWFRTDL